MTLEADLKKPGSMSAFSRAISLLRRFSDWRSGTGVILIILGLALATRTVGLSSFPYFPAEAPWYGINGIFTDESYITSAALNIAKSVYYPYLQVVLMNFAINVLSYTTFAARLVPALFSSVTSILVYLSSLELFHKRTPAILSSLYFIFMTPALVYGRMAFAENSAATFFVATFLFVIKYANTSKNRWLTFSGVSAGLSFLCKQTGFAATIFLILFIFAFKREAKHKLLKPLLIAGILMSTYFLQIMILNPSYLSQLSSTFIFYSGDLPAWLSVFFCNLVPSGVNVRWINSPQAPYMDLYWFAALDFWYVLAFAVIIYLVVKERRAVREVVLAILSFVLVLIVIGHINTYYVIMVQPFMAIPLGYGLLKLQQMSGVPAVAFSLLLCFPAITSIDYYVSYFLAGNGGDIVWTVMQFAIAIPIAILGIIRLGYKRMKSREATMINGFLLVFYVVCLIIGSYLLPAFYPGYFAQSSVPI
jgi:4-amino-4-deoxy-L-arabinose transferase-like glycosyltransferase